MLLNFYWHLIYAYTILFEHEFFFLNIISYLNCRRKENYTSIAASVLWPNQPSYQPKVV